MMEQFSRIFRIFISSTFSDLKVERNALQEKVFPYLSNLAEANGCRFQAMDLRWGISDEAGLDQQTMRICLEEIARCQRITPQPNFLILLGDRYGWCPLPYEITSLEFDLLLNQMYPDEITKTLEWYQRDDNAVPSTWMLQPRRGIYTDPAAWENVESDLHAILEKAALSANLPETSLIKYQSSATEQEILNGLINMPGADKHVFCYARQLRYDGKDDPQTEKLNTLKMRLEHVLGDHYREYAHAIQNEDRIDRLCKDVRNDLEQLITSEISRVVIVDPQELEIAAHSSFAEDRRRGFFGRATLLDEMQKTLPSKKEADKQQKSKIFVLYGESGSGKSAVMAQAARQIGSHNPDIQCISRFIGATPASTNRSYLLGSLCLEIQQRYTRASWLPSDLPVDYRSLIEEFTLYLYLAEVSEEKPLYLFIDGLDLLRGDDVDWVPDLLPDYVFLFLSTTPGLTLELLKSRLSKKAEFLNVDKLTLEESVQLMEHVLQQNIRKLQPLQKQIVIEHIKAHGLPLFEKLILEQAVTWPSYLPIENIHIGVDVPQAVNSLLDFLENTSQHGEILVCKTLGYLQAARNGLSENELLGILSKDLAVYEWFLNTQHHAPSDLLHAVCDLLRKKGRESSPTSAQLWLDSLKGQEGALRTLLEQITADNVKLQLPVVLWSRLYADLEPYLMQKYSDGQPLFAFFHQQFSQVVTDRYLSGEKEIEYQRGLADYFASQPAYFEQASRRIPNGRKLSEQLFHQVKARQWKQIAYALADYDFLHAQIKSGSLQFFLSDLAQFSTESEAPEYLHLLESALRASKQTLEADADQLPSQLTGRLLLHKSIFEVNNLLESMKSHPNFWLRPTEANLTPAGTALIHNMFGHSKGVLSLACSPDSARILSGSSDKTAIVWNARNGELQTILKGHIDTVDDIWVTADNRYAVTSSFDVGTQLLVWDLATGMQVSAFGHEGVVMGLGFSPDNLSAISICSEGYIIQWSLEDGEEIFSTREESGFESLAVTPDGKIALASTGENQLQIWDLHACKQRASLPGPPGEEVVLALSADGKMGLAAGDPVSMRLIDGIPEEQGIIRIIDIQAGKLLQPLQNKASTALALSPNSQLALAGSSDGKIRVWDLKTHQLQYTLEGHTDKVTEILISLDGKRAVSSARNDPRIMLWNLEIGKLITTLVGHGADINKLLLSPDGKYVISGSSDKSVKTWNLYTNRKLDLPGQNTGIISDLSFSAANERLISVSKDGYIRKWNLTGGSPLVVVNVYSNSIPTCVASDAFGERTVVGFEDGSLAIWDLTRNKQLQYLPGGHGRVNGVAITYDGKKAYAIYDDGKLLSWNAENGKLLLDIVAYSHEGRKLIGWKVATIDSGRWAVTCSLSYKGILIWNMETGVKQAFYGGHNDLVAAVAITHGGRIAASGSQDTTIRVFDIVKGSLLTVLSGHTDSVREIALEEKEHLVVSAGDDCTLRVWNWENNQQLACFTGEKPFTGCVISGRNIAASDEAGRMHFFKLEG